MAGRVQFTIDLFLYKPELFPELTERVKDLRPAFEVVIKKWAKDNQDKFDKSKGAGLTGASVDPAVFWQPLTPGTMKSKEKRGYPNQIMVATGELESVLTDPGRFAQAMTMQDVAFGSPLDSFNQDKVRYNYKKRQTIFLSVDDQRMIDKTFGDYFALGGDFQQIMFARGLQSSANRNEAATMNMEFEDALADDGD